MPLPDKTRYAILGALGLMPMSGYDIKKFCDSSVGHFWNENYARIYPVLKYMDREGLVTCEPRKNGNRPLKNVYSITAKGRDDLERWLLKPAEERRLREELLLKLFFSENVPLENLLGKLETEKRKNIEYLEEYERIENFLKTDPTTRNAPGLPLWLSTIDFGRHFRQGVVEWCDETAASLKKMNSLPAGQTGNETERRRNR